MAFRNGNNEINIDLLNQTEKKVINKYRDIYDKYCMYTTNHKNASKEIMIALLFPESNKLMLKGEKESVLNSFNDIWKKSSGNGLMEIDIPARQGENSLVGSTNENILRYAQGIAKTDLEKILLDQIIRLNDRVDGMLDGNEECETVSEDIKDFLYGDKNISIDEFHIQSNLKQILIAKGMSQTALAEKTGISRASVINSMKDDCGLSLEIAHKMAFILDVSIDELFPFLLKK